MKHHIIRLTGLLSILVLALATMAGTWSPNNFFYQPSIGARGSAEKKDFDAGLARVDAHLGRYKTLGDPGYATLSEALNTIGTETELTLTIAAGTVPVTGNTTIPSNITLKVLRGGKFDISNGRTLTIQGPLEAGPYRIFSCAGTGAVAFAAGTTVRKYPQWWGIDGSDDNVPIQAALTSGTGEVFLLDGTYSTSGTITISKDDRLVLSQGAAIEPAANIDVVKIERGGWFEGGEIDVGGVGTYSKAAVTFAASSAGDYIPWGISHTRLRSSGDRGTGIKLASNTAQVTWVHIHDMDITKFNIGIDLDASAGSWVTANYLHNLQLQCKYNIRMEKAGGNQISNVVVQAYGTAQKALLANGTSSTNYIQMFVYDWGSAASNIAISLGEGCFSNMIVTGGFASTGISDYGWGNSFMGFTPETLYNSPLIHGAVPPSSYAKPSFTGNQDDYLTFMNVRGSVSADKDVDGGNLANVFDLNPNNYAQWSSSRCPVAITIELPASVNLNQMGIIFRLATFSVNDILIETYNGENWHTFKTFTEFGYEHAVALRSEEETPGASSNVSQIRITINDCKGSAVRLEKIYLYTSTRQAECWLPVNGGELYGNVKFDADVTLGRAAANVLALGNGDGLGVGNSVNNSNTPSGPTAKAVPIYDHAGNLMGYIPVYESQW